MKHIFIINPVSGSGKYKDVITWIERNSNLNDEDYELYLTKYPKHAEEIAKQYQGDYILYAVGGDGTAHEVLNGKHSSTQMAIVPVGTGNDFSRMISNGQSLDDFMHSIVYQSKIELIDIGVVNGTRFLNCSNLGVDADINAKVNQKRKTWIPRSFLYLTVALGHLASIKPYHISIHAEGEVLEKSITLVSVMNGKWYGGGFKSAPKANLQDGFFDVCIVDSVSSLRALVLIGKYMKGWHTKEKEVVFKKLKNFEIRSQSLINYGCDGEVSKDNVLKFEMLEQYLKLKMPEASHFVV